MKRLCVVVALLLAVGCGGDGGTGDGGTDGGGAIDGGGSVDSGAPDGGPSDSGPSDSGAPDGGGADSGTDSGPADAGMDSGAGGDAGTDAGATDAGMTDSGPSDDGGAVDGGGDAGGDLDAGAFGIGGVDYRTIARGGSLMVRGAGFTGATSASLGGVAHAVSSVTDTSLVVGPIDATTPLGRQALTITTGAGTTAPFDVQVIHLQINEVEVDSPGAEDAEFIEISVGVDATVSLEGYVLAHYNGATTGGGGAQPRVFSIDLDEGGATTDANGLLLIADEGVPAAADIVLRTDIQQGEDLLAIYQRRTAAPDNLADVGTTGLIDAVVWESGSDTDETALDALTVGAVRVVQLGLTTAARDTTTIQRCGREAALRDLTSFERETPSPGQPNHCGDAVAALPACVIDFGTVCPDEVPGGCGAFFQANRSASCVAPSDARCAAEGIGFGADVSDGGAQMNIFFDDGAVALDLFLAGQGAADATMRFFALDGSEVDVVVDDAAGVLEVAVDCQDTDVTVPAIRRVRQEGTSRFIRRAQITRDRMPAPRDMRVWIDNFVINPT